MPVTGLYTVQQVSCLEALTRCPAPSGPGSALSMVAASQSISGKCAHCRGARGLQQRHGASPARFGSLGSGWAQKLQVMGPRVFLSVLLKEAKFQGAELDLLKLRLNPGGAPRGAGERLLPVKKTVGLAEGLLGSQPLLCSATPPTNPMQLWEQDWGRRGE